MGSYTPVTREVSAAADGDPAIELKASPKKRPPATKK
jgi:hypothetical protein